MSQTLLQRSTALSLAALITLGMLGSIDHLAQRDGPPAAWAKSAPQPVAAAPASQRA